MSVEIIVGLVGALVTAACGFGWHRAKVSAAREQGRAQASAEHAARVADVQADLRRKDAAIARIETVQIEHAIEEDEAARSQPPDDLGDLIEEARLKHERRR